MTIETRTETIDAKWAQDALSKNMKNFRKYRSERHVARLRDDMLAGSWQENGESIKFDVDGNLVDGQHRLAAVIQADVEIRSSVTRGLPTGADLNLDSGKVRNITDVLKDLGEKNARVLSSALRLICCLDRVEDPVAGSLRRALSIREYLETHRRHPKLGESVSTRGQRPSWARFAGVIVLHYKAGRMPDSQEIADKFFHGLATGEDLNEGNPVRLLREKLANDYIKAVHLLDIWARTALVFKAWNIFVRGDTREQLRWRPSLEGFPELLNAEG